MAGPGMPGAPIPSAHHRGRPSSRAAPPSSFRYPMAGYPVVGQPGGGPPMGGHGPGSSMSRASSRSRSHTIDPLGHGLPSRSGSRSRHNPMQFGHGVPPASVHPSESVSQVSSRHSRHSHRDALALVPFAPRSHAGQPRAPYPEQDGPAYGPAPNQYGPPGASQVAPAYGPPAPSQGQHAYPPPATRSRASHGGSASRHSHHGPNPDLVGPDGRVHHPRCPTLRPDKVVLMKIWNVKRH